MNQVRNVARIRVTTAVDRRRTRNVTNRPSPVSCRRLPTEERPVEQSRPPAHVFVDTRVQLPARRKMASPTTRVRRPPLLLSLNHARRRVE